MSLLEWLAVNYTSYGSQLELVTDSSEHGSQFVNGFGGLGAILRYRVEMPSGEENEVETTIAMGNSILTIIKKQESHDKK